MAGIWWRVDSTSSYAASRQPAGLPVPEQTWSTHSDDACRTGDAAAAAPPAASHLSRGIPSCALSAGNPLFHYGNTNEEVLPLCASHTYFQEDHLEMDADGESPREEEEEEVAERKEGEGEVLSQGCDRGLD